ncbi:carbohydrate ABC transporter permease [Actinospica durhamensis]|uniref:Carbohydrate ABC transporter permease n=1 Tax=Actinospica durhamensis TaxID=1508375 RepID=A0A941EN97_9ACTN|nr:carbohydrate ABC transporter permease [Actinospica durhamensis]MBR7834190.1 carbohydrate ABC transporter permease [Actinospica durhamensis]
MSTVTETGRRFRPASARGFRKPDQNRRPVWEEKPSWYGQFGKGSVITVVMLLILVPVWGVVLTSFSDKGSINSAGGGLVLIPHGLSLQNYQLIFSGGTVSRALFVTVLITVVGTAISMVVSVLCAYGLSRSSSFAQRPVLMTLVVTMFFNGGIIPTFLVVNDLKLYGSLWALILPSAVNVFNILVLRAFFTGTASELIEAARLDGASEWRVLWSVVVPTSRAVIAVITMFYAVAYWGTFFNAILYESENATNNPLAVVIYDYTLLGTTMPGMGTTGVGGLAQASQTGLSMATVTLSLIPIVVLTPFVQRHFAKGMLTGAVKG